jgi:hypothetical protein
MSRYGDRQSLMTVQTGSFQSRTTAIKVSAVLPERKLEISLPDSRSTPPDTHCPLTLSPLVFAPTELAVVDFVDLVRTADFPRAAQHVV